MSCKRKVESFSPIEVKITCIDKNSVCEIEEAAITAVKQKLEKLNIILKNLNLYCHDNVLLINDRYGTSKDLEEIACAFGLNIKHIECGLRGKSYILQDGLIELIKVINPEFSIAEYANIEITAELVSLINKHKVSINVDSDITEILRAIKEKGYYSVNGMQKVTTVYYDGRIIDQSLGEIVSNEVQVTTRLKQYITKMKGVLDKENENLRDGTVKLLYSRARQMGYKVKEERNGTQVQLVLVRCE